MIYYSIIHGLKKIVVCIVKEAGMNIGRIRAVLTAAIIIIFLFSSCDEMDLTLPITRNYHVSVRGEDYPLDEYAVLRVNEGIQPFFISPINNDPDVTGLTISIMTIDTLETVATVRYVLESTSENDRSTFDEDGEEVQIIDISRIDGSLPSFFMPEDLEAGPYVMVFQVFGRNQALLSRSERNFYYIAADDYNITDISAHLPGLLSVQTHLIPPETVVLLEAGITAGYNLDPYIIWFNGRNIIGEGRVSEGANALLWQVPSQPGFQNIRAEVVPFPPIPDPSVPGSNLERILRGKAREISLPISAKRESQGDFSELLGMIQSDEGKILWFYHPAGELDDPLSPLPENTLLAWVTDSEEEDENAPNWISAQEGFGLGIGPDDIYTLPVFFPEPESRLSFALRFVSLNDGNYFNVSFYPSGTEFTFLREEGAFFLVLHIEDEEELIPVEIPLGEDFITLFLDMSFYEESLLLSLKENGDETPRAQRILDQWDPDGVQGIIQLGGLSSQAFPVMVLGELCIVSFPVDPLLDEITITEETLIARAP